MTISKDEFDRGELKDNQYKAIESFLKENQDNAYSLDELLLAVFDRHKPDTSLRLPDLALDMMEYTIFRWMVDSILNGMISEGKIAKKSISLEIYYLWIKKEK